MTQADWVKELLNKLICFFNGHVSGKAVPHSLSRNKNPLHQLNSWDITCSRCGYSVTYRSFLDRNLEIERLYGFKG